jgi:HTH-type transcriptional regulator / antitoxin HigA
LKERKMADVNFTDDSPIHPGEFVREELEARGLGQVDLAYILNVPVSAVNMIIAGKRGISPEMAKALGAAFDVSAELFSNLQRSFDLARAREPDPGVAQRARLSTAYPVREMIRRGWLTASDDANTLEKEMAAFFEVASLNDIPHLVHAAKKTRYDDTPAEQLAWLFRVRQIAKSMPAVDYSEDALRSALTRLKSLVSAPESARHVPRILAECGVRFVVVETLPRSKIDGVCFWINGSPVIGMSLQHDRIDNFWFVLRHEIEHVLRRDGQEVAVIDADLDSESDANLPEEERAANAAAAEFCVPQNQMQSFILRKSPFFSERDVLAFAKRSGVHAGIVVGQIQKRTGRWDFLRKHLAKVRPHIVPSAMTDGFGQTAPI